MLFLANAVVLHPMTRHIPNLLTLANLFCGCCALLYTFYWHPGVAAFFTACCFLFDYLDGMAARALNVCSPIGKELDSLADVVSFGVVPGAMLYQLLSLNSPALVPGFSTTLIDFAALPAFVLSAFSALRLAKFNLDTRQTEHFLGLSTPACTVFVLGLALTAHHDLFGLRETLENQWLVYGLIAILSALLVSEIPMFGMKIKGCGLRQYTVHLVFLALFAVFVFFLKALAFSAIIVAYVLGSVMFRDKV